MKKSTQILAVLLSSFALSGVVEGSAPAGAEWPLAFAVSHMFFTSILLFAWCGAHASESHVTLPPGGKPLVALIPPFGVPYYFLRGFGMKQGAVKTGKGILFYGMCIGAYAALFYPLQNT